MFVSEFVGKRSKLRQLDKHLRAMWVAQAWRWRRHKIRDCLRYNNLREDEKFLRFFLTWKSCIYFRQLLEERELFSSSSDNSASLTLGFITLKALFDEIKRTYKKFRKSSTLEKLQRIFDKDSMKPRNFFLLNSTRLLLQSSTPAAFSTATKPTEIFYKKQISPRQVEAINFFQIDKVFISRCQLS